MIEAAAKAIFQVYADASHMKVLPWEEQDAVDRELAKRAARAAIESVGAMDIEVYKRAIAKIPGEDYDLLDYWGAQISAILEESN